MSEQTSAVFVAANQGYTLRILSIPCLEYWIVSDGVPEGFTLYVTIFECGFECH